MRKAGLNIFVFILLLKAVYKSGSCTSNCIRLVFRALFYGYESLAVRENSVLSTDVSSVCLVVHVGEPDIWQCLARIRGKLQPDTIDITNMTLTCVFTVGDISKYTAKFFT